MDDSDCQINWYLRRAYPRPLNIPIATAPTPPHTHTKSTWYYSEFSRGQTGSEEKLASSQLHLVNSLYHGATWYRTDVV